MKTTTQCIECGKTFSSYNPHPKFCSRECKTASRIEKVDFEKVKTLYESGKSQVEIAEELGTSQKVIFNTFRRAGYKCRIAVKRNQRGPLNPGWKGKDAVYSSMHERVYRLFGKPCHCEVCGTTEPNLRYEWANVSGDYNDVYGYKRMCARCHRRFDKSDKGVRINVKLRNNR